MANYSSCPNCGRKAKESLSSNFFPVYKCRECGVLYCQECGGTTSPHCGSAKRTEAGKVYAR